MIDRTKIERFARRSLGDPYLCKMAWPEDCFVQCDGRGIVFTDGRLSEALDDPAKAKEAVGAALGGRAV